MVRSTLLNRFYSGIRQGRCKVMEEWLVRREIKTGEAAEELMKLKRPAHRVVFLVRIGSEKRSKIFLLDYP